MAEGSYLKLGVGRTTINDSSATANNHLTGFSLAYGTQLDPVWGVEGGLVDFGRATSFDLNNQPFKVDLRALYGAGTGTWPVNSQVSVVGKLGLAVKHASGGGDSVTKTSLMAGIGARWMFNNEWGATVDYTHYGKEEGTTISQTSISAIYSF
jgi:hypothetical protein